MFYVKETQNDTKQNDICKFLSMSALNDKNNNIKTCQRTWTEQMFLFFLNKMGTLLNNEHHSQTHLKEAKIEYVVLLWASEAERNENSSSIERVLDTHTCDGNHSDSTWQY